MQGFMLFVLGVFFIVQLDDVIGAKPRFAPKYCLRFKFDCSSPQKKGHVCCLFPLPLDGNKVGEETAIPDTVPSVKVGVQKIRPLRLPSRRKGDENNAGQEQSSNGNERYDVFNQKNRAESQKADAKKSANNAPKLKEASQRKTPVKKENPTNSRSSAKRPSIRPRRPFICRRLVINCEKSPKHTCCKFEAEQAKAEQAEKEELEKNNSTEEVKTDTTDTTVETPQENIAVGVSTSPIEENVESLKTLPERTLEKNKVDLAPITRNSVGEKPQEA